MTRHQLAARLLSAAATTAALISAAPAYGAPQHTPPSTSQTIHVDNAITPSTNDELVSALRSAAGTASRVALRVDVASQLSTRLSTVDYGTTVTTYFSPRGIALYTFTILDGSGKLPICRTGRLGQNDLHLCVTATVRRDSADDDNSSGPAAAAERFTLTPVRSSDQVPAIG